MPDRDAYSLNGYILEWPVRQIERGDLIQSHSIRFREVLPNSRWETFEFISSVPLRGEDTDNTPGPFRYILVCRRSGPRILLLSLNRQIVEHVLEETLNRVFLPALRRVPIGVDALVKNLTLHPRVYALSFVHARVPAFGTSLRAVSFYGEDLAEASLFRENAPLMNFFTCGLRRAHGGGEILRIGNDGTISFYMRGPESVLEVEEALHFLREQGCLPDYSASQSS